MKKVFILCVILLNHASISFAQNTQIKTLKIGDTIPNLEVTFYLQNVHRREHVKNIYKQGLLIINFWATWCVPCIKELPRLDSLAEQYKNNLSIVSVTLQRREKVAKFFNDYPNLKPRYLKVATNDTMFYKLFPHKIIPHNIWVDSNGVIKAITGDREIDNNNIAYFLSDNGANVTMAIKQDNIEFDFTKPLHVTDTGFIYRSVITRYRDDINGGEMVDRNEDQTKIKRYLGWNRTIVDFLWKSYQPDFGGVNYNVLRLTTKDSSKFLWPMLNRYFHMPQLNESREKWLNKNVYCYELSIPKGVNNKLFYSYINDDICRYFNLKTFVKKEMIPCWVITKRPHSKKFQPTKYKKYYNALFGNGKDSAILTARNVTLLQILEHSVNRLEHPYHIPFVNLTGINYPIDLTLQFTGLTHAAVSIDLVKEALSEQYGLVFERKNYSYPVFHIYDENSTK